MRLHPGWARSGGESGAIGRPSNGQHPVQVTCPSNGSTVKPGRSSGIHPNTEPNRAIRCLIRANDAACDDRGGPSLGRRGTWGLKAPQDWHLFVHIRRPMEGIMETLFHSWSLSDMVLELGVMFMNKEVLFDSLLVG